jgi:hypothetical protein
MDNSNDLVNPIYAGIEEEQASGIGLDGEFQDTVLTKFQTTDQQTHWQKEIDASRREHQEFVKRGFKTIDIYGDKRDDSSNRANYNVFFANTETKLAAMYAQTPKPDIKRRFNDPDDQASRVGSEILTRNIEFELDVYNFDGKVKQILFDRVVPGIGVGWVRYEREGGDQVEQQVPHPQAGQFIAHPETGEPTLVPQDATTTQVATTPITHEVADIDYVSWDDFLWAPCRVWSLCRWVGRRISMSKDALEARFKGKVPDNYLSAISYAKDEGNKKVGDDRRSTPKYNTEYTTDVFEIWDKEEGLIWWISESCDVPLDVREDTLEFDGFFPTPIPPLARVTTSNTIPISDYSEVQDLYRELDTLSHRTSMLSQALQIKFVYNGAFPELKDLILTTSELEGVPVKDWGLMNEQGGLAGAIQFMPLDELVKSYTQMSAARDAVKNQINEIEGISDMFRGASTPNETTLATAQKSAFGTARISIIQSEVAAYLQGLLRLKAHLICKFYSPQTLMERAGAISQADQAFVSQALQVLKDGAMNHYKLNISVDSIQLPNWNLEKAQKTEVIGTIFQGLQQIAPLAQQQPQLVPFFAKIIKWGITGYKGAQQIEGDIDQMLQSMQQMAAQKQSAPPQPTPAQLTQQTKQAQIQSQQQIAQDTNQTRLQIAQLQASIDEKDLDLRAQEQELDRLKMMVGINDDAHTHAHNVAVHISTPQVIKP